MKALRAQNPQADLVLQTMNTAWDSPDEPSHKKYASNRPHLADYYDAYRKYAHEHALPLVDNYPHWLKLQQTDEAKFKKWLPEGLHSIPRSQPGGDFTRHRSIAGKSAHGREALKF